MGRFREPCLLAGEQAPHLQSCKSSSDDTPVAAIGGVSLEVKGTLYLSAQGFDPGFALVGNLDRTVPGRLTDTSETHLSSMWLLGASK